MNPKAKYIDEIEATIKIKVYEIICPKCNKTFLTQRWGTGKINAVPCKFCDCMFNALWE